MNIGNDININYVTLRTRETS